MPTLSAAVLRLFIPADGMGLWQCGLVLADLILSGAQYTQVKAGRKLKRVAGVPSILVLLPNAFAYAVHRRRRERQHYTSPIS